MKKLISFCVTFTVFLLLPKLVHAQEPNTDMCINGTISNTTYSFTGSGMPPDIEILSGSLWDTAFGYWPGCDPVGEHVPNNYLRSVGLCDGQRRVGFSTISLDISSPFTGTLTALSMEGTSDTPNRAFRCYDGAAWVYLGAGASVPIPQGTICSNVIGYNSRNGSFPEQHIDSFTITCGVGIYTPTLITCDLVPNADFTTVDNWLLGGSSTITNSILTLTPGDNAAQNLYNLTDNTSYTALISITQISSTTLAVVLGNEAEYINVSNTGIYSATFTTPNLAGPLAYGFQNTGSANIGIDYTCLSLAATGPEGEEQYTCLAPPNGDFSTAANWDYYRGAFWATSAKTVRLPYPEQGLIRASNTFTVPALAAGENLLMSFDAMGDGGNAAIAGRVNGTNASIEFSFETFAQSYQYEINVSDLYSVGDQTGQIAFVNPGLAGFLGVTSDKTVVLDNVCVFIANRGAQLPEPTDPTSFNPVDLGDFYTCQDTQTYLASWDIDIRYHRENYQNTPGVWDYSDWVPWLISAGWVGLDVYLCTFVVGIKTAINLAEYAVNEGLNYANWGRLSAAGFVPWVGQWALNAWISNANWLQAVQTTAEDWLTWAALAVVEFASIPDEVIVTNLLTLALYLLFGFLFLGGLGVQLALYAWAVGEYTLIGLLNTLIGEGWNPFLIAVGQVISAVMDDLIYIWNTGLLPALVSMVVGPLGLVSVLAVLPVFWGLFWAVIMWIWANVFQTLYIPFGFYTGLNDGLQSNTFGNLMGCDGTTINFWCNLFAGLDILNTVAGHSIFYPIVIVGITMGTIVILYKNVMALWNFYADFITKI